jgi:NAD(P)H-nitrite reductase large subunit
MIGAGFVGLIVLNAMFKRQWELTVIEREGQLLPRMLNQPAAEIAAQWLQDQHVGVHCDRSVQAIEQGSDTEKQVVLDDGTRVPADLVIVATGVRPNTELATGTTIETDHGILVDEHLRTSVPTIFAAGDVAQGPVLHQDHREVHAIQPTAVDHGRIAGANMAGQSIAYQGSLSMNVLDICGLQSASFGTWQDENAEQTVIYNPKDSIYRCLSWTDDRLTGAIFVGRANNLGMLTDVGMVKGMIQTGAGLGPWKDYLSKNPFDVRRAFVAAQVPQQLMKQQLLGTPAKARQFRYDSPPTRHQPGPSHQAYVKSRP